jgi:uncharacterized membrane protein YfcA
VVHVLTSGSSKSSDDDVYGSESAVSIVPAASTSATGRPCAPTQLGELGNRNKAWNGEANEAPLLRAARPRTDGDGRTLMAADEATINPGRFLRNLLDFRYREVTMVIATGAVVAGSIALFPGTENLTRGIQSNVGPGAIALLVLVAVAAGAVKGAIGFGYALITTPIFATVIDPALAVVILAIPPWMINLFQLAETNTGTEYVRREKTLIALALVGAFAGVFLFAAFSTGPAIPFLIGVMIFGYVLFQVSQSFVTIEGAHHPVALGVVGLLEGVLLSVANLGPLLPAYLHTFERDTDRYVGGLGVVLGAIFTAKILGLAVFGVIGSYQVWLGSVIAVVTIVGMLLGSYLRRLEINEARFNWAVNALLFVISLNILRNTIPALFL